MSCGPKVTDSPLYPDHQWLPNRRRSAFNIHSLLNYLRTNQKCQHLHMCTKHTFGGVRGLWHKILIPIHFLHFRLFSFIFNAISGFDFFFYVYTFRRGGGLIFILFCTLLKMWTFFVALSKSLKFMICTLSRGAIKISMPHEKINFLCLKEFKNFGILYIYFLNGYKCYKSKL